MWQNRGGNSGGPPKFFYISLSHDSLGNMYNTNFALMQYHNYSLTELDSMYPFEREIYLNMLIDYLEKKKQQAQQG